jgi:uncharacterized protein YcbX
MHENHPLGTIARLWRYPVKSLAGEALERADLATEGLVGDRVSALFVAHEGHARNGKTFRGKEHNLLHTVTTIGDAQRLAADRDVALSARSDGPYFDDAPVSVLVDRWLAEAERLVGYALDPLRYRPNLYVRAAADFAGSETDLVGTVLSAGDVRLRVSHPIERCVTTTYDVRTGESDPAVLRAVAQRRANLMGVYCVVEAPGSVRVGDRLVILAGG